jgi:hypothetical protein
MAQPPERSAIMSLIARAALYAAAAALVLGYVALTTGGRTSSTVADAQVAPDSTSTAANWTQRVVTASGVTALWIVVDVILAARLANADATTRYLLRALVAWGSLLALGAMLSGGRQPLLAAGIVFGVTAAFVGFWVAALSTRRRRQAVVEQPGGGK